MYVHIFSSQDFNLFSGDKRLVGVHTLGLGIEGKVCVKPEDCRGYYIQDKSCYNRKCGSTTCYHGKCTCERGTLAAAGLGRACLVTTCTKVIANLCIKCTKVIANLHIECAKVVVNLYKECAKLIANFCIEHTKIVANWYSKCAETVANLCAFFI